MTSLADRITDRLKDVGLTANAASIMAGGKRDLIRNIQRGKSKVPRGDMLLGLAKILQVPIEFFDDSFCDEIPKVKPSVVSKIPEPYLKAAMELSEIDQEDRDSLMLEISCLAKAARARRARGG